MNGEDILFNFVAANASVSTTGAGGATPPFIVKSLETLQNVMSAFGSESGSADGETEQKALSSRQHHFGDRSRLFNTFAKYFNDRACNSSRKIETVPPYAAAWNAVTMGGDGSANSDSKATATTTAAPTSASAGVSVSSALVLPQYTSPIEQPRIQDALQGRVAVLELLEAADLPVGTTIYEFSAEGSSIRMSNGAMYTSVMDHRTIQQHLKNLGLPEANSPERFSHWVAVAHS